MEEIHIEVVSYEEQEDGSAIITLDLNKPARDFLVGEGLKAIIMNQVKNTMEGLDDEKDTCCGACSSDVGC